MTRRPKSTLRHGPDMSLKEDAMLFAGGVAVIVLAAWYAKRKITQGAGELYDWTAQTISNTVPYVNPADGNNVVNQGVNWFGALASGDKNFSLGTKLYDWTH